jgi:RimJ/RimL family protein N-acetyltransferase
MEIQDSLYEGQLVHLTAIDYEKDPPVEASWSQHPLFLRMLSAERAAPKSPEQVKKNYARIEKQSEESRNLFHIAIRTLPDKARIEEGAFEERLLGFAEIYWIEWTHGAAWLRLGIGNPQDWRKGYGSGALRLLLRYAFDELNLRRLSAEIPEYNQAALRLFQKARFSEEVRRREALHRDGQRWDLLHLGLLGSEWERS